MLFVTAATTLAKHSAGKKNQGGKGKGGTKNKNNKNKHQLGSKSYKDGSKPSKGGGGGGGKKGNFDECVFANPILRQTGVEDVGIADISHAEAVNYVFEDAVTSWMMDNGMLLLTSCLLFTYHLSYITYIEIKISSTNLQY